MLRATMQDTTVLSEPLLAALLVTTRRKNVRGCKENKNKMEIQSSQNSSMSFD